MLYAGIFIAEFVYVILATLELIVTARGLKAAAVILTGTREVLAVLLIYFIASRGLSLLPVFVLANVLGTWVGMVIWERRDASSLGVSSLWRLGR